MRKRMIDVLLFCGIVGIVIIILFHSYILGDRYFLFPNVVTDGVAQFYPEYVQKAESGAGSFFSFIRAWGSGGGNYNPFDILLGIFGSQHVAYMMGIVMMLKCMISGIVFYGFLREKGMKQVTCIVFGCCYAFSIQVIGGGCWKTQAELAIIAAIFLWAIERWKKNRSLALAVLGIALSVLCLGLYFQLMLAAFLFLYCVAEVYQSGYKPQKHFSIVQKKIFLAVGTVCAIVIGVVLYQKLSVIFQSYRFQAGVQSIGTEWDKTFSFDNIKIIATAVIRTFAPNILGIPGANEYYGSDTGWYIGDGGYYCGILTILLIPQVFHRDTKKRNIVVWVELGICSMIAVCPVFRLLINGFANDIYKLSRVWVILIMLLIAAIAFEEIVTKKRHLDRKRLFVTWGITILLIIVACIKLQGRVYYYDVFIYLLISSLEVLMLVLYSRKRVLSGNKMIYAVTVLVLMEVLFLNYKFINNKDAVTKAEWISGFYNDGTGEVLEQSEQEEVFERIDKTYQSVQLNDAAVQGYNGTSYYVGGIGNSDMTDFVMETSIPTIRKLPGWCLGTVGNVYLESLFSVNKLISDSDNCSSYGFSLENTLNDKYLYKNNHFLPLGFCYDKVISRSTFQEMDPLDRAKGLLAYAVVEDGSEEFEKFRVKEKGTDTKAEALYTDEIEDYAVGSIIELPMDMTEDKTVVVELQSKDEVSVNVCWVETDGKFGYQYASSYEKNGKTKVELSRQDNIKNIVIYNNFDDTIQKIDKVKVSVFLSQEYYKEFEEQVRARKENILHIQQYSEEHIRGIVESKKEQLLFLSIPYSADFKYYLDGEEVPKEKVNIAFTGVYLPAGEHKLEIIYQKNLFKNKLVISAGIITFWLIITGALRIVRKCSLRNRRKV